MGEDPPLNKRCNFWKCNTFISHTCEVLGRIVLSEAVGTLVGGEPLEVSHCFDVSGRLDNSHGIKSWMVPATPLGSYEHTAFIGWR